MAHPTGSNDTERTKRTHIASNKVRDPANDAELKLPSHREAQTQAQCAHAMQVAQPTANMKSSSFTTISVPSTSALSVPPTTATSTLSHKRSSASVADADNNDDHKNEITNGGSSCRSPEGNDSTFLLCPITDT